MALEITDNIPSLKYNYIFYFHFRTRIPLRGRPELSSFSRAYTEYGGGKRSAAAVHFFKMFIMIYDALYFHTGSLNKNQDFKSTILRVGHKKGYSVYAFGNVDNSGSPLNN